MGRGGDFGRAWPGCAGARAAQLSREGGALPPRLPLSATSVGPETLLRADSLRPVEPAVKGTQDGVVGRSGRSVALRTASQYARASRGRQRRSTIVMPECRLRNTQTIHSTKSRSAPATP